MILEILHLKIISLWDFSCYSFAHSQAKFFLRTQSHCRTCTEDPHAVLIKFITRMTCINRFLFFFPFLKHICICFNSTMRVFKQTYETGAYLLAGKAAGSLALTGFLSFVHWTVEKSDRWCEIKYFKDGVSDSDSLRGLPGDHRRGRSGKAVLSEGYLLV